MRKHLSRRSVVAGIAIGPAIAQAAPAAAHISGEDLETVCRAAERYNAAEAAQSDADESTPEGAALAHAYDEASEAFLTVAEATWREPVRSPADLIKHATIARVDHARSNIRESLDAIGDLGLFDRADLELVVAVLTLLDQGAFGVQVTDRLARAE